VPPTAEQIATALSLPFDRAQMRRIVSELAALGSAPSGFRVTGTPEDRAAARLAAAEMRAIGLQEVSVETVPVYGWRMLFLVGGILPLVLAAALLKVLPESPRYLARRRERWPELRALLGQLGHVVPADAAFLDGTEKAVSKTSVRELFVTFEVTLPRSRRMVTTSPVVIA